MSSEVHILRVAIPSPRRDTFDYLPPAGHEIASLRPGMRLSVPFGRGTRVGVLLGTASEAKVPQERLKRALQVLDEQPALPPDMLELLLWSSDYYHHPIGEVLSTALPVALRKAKRPEVRRLVNWYLTPAGETGASELPARATRQAAVIELLRQHPQGLSPKQFRLRGTQAVLRTLEARGWAQRRSAPFMEAVSDPVPGPILNPAQQAAVDAVRAAPGFQVFMLDGVTGSGKTEVYLRLAAECVAAGKQALVLLPEIGLTVQTVERFRRRLGAPVALIHSGLTEQERLNAWWLAREGIAPLLIGTRSAALTPLARPGLIIVDEEHDLSFKQHEGFRYNARDLAVMRAQWAGVPVVLGSATPSLESLHNVRRGRYRRLELPQRAGVAQSPEIHLLDVLGRPMEAGLSESLLHAVQGRLQQREQVMLFLNRRGYAPILLCHECGWVAGCDRCDAALTLHQRSRLLRCHHCGAERSVPRQCAACGSPALLALGQGTERLEQALAERFPEAGIVRIDRDTARRKGAFQGLLERVHSGEAQILIGTQMLAKGYHFPNVTLVAVIDADQGLFSADFRAPERMAQLILQVAGRAGRAEKPGQVLIQTHHPRHPLLQLLVTEGYQRFAQAALAERACAALPPFTCFALLRAEAPQPEVALAFLRQSAAAAAALPRDNVQLLGPMPAPMERRAGRYRAQLLIQSRRRADLHAFLEKWVGRVEGLKGVRRVRWSLDVDPMEMF